MLRRRPDDTFEFRDVERALYSAAPHSLSPERREALRHRVFSELGVQDRSPRTFAKLPAERWITVPAGVSIAAAVIAATNYILDEHDSRTETTWVATAAGPITIDGVRDTAAEPGQRIEATGPSWVAVGRYVRVGLESGSSFRFASSGDRLALLLDAGTHHVLSQQSLLEVRGQRWVARMTGPGALEVSIHQWYSSLVALEGETIVQFAGSTYLLRPGDRPLLLMAQPPDDPGSSPQSGGSGPSPASGGGSPNTGPVVGPEVDDGSVPEDITPASTETPTGPDAPGAAGQAAPGQGSPGPGGGATSPPGAPPAPPEGVPPSEPPPADRPAGPPADPPGAPPTDPPGGPPSDPPGGPPADPPGGPPADPPGGPPADPPGGPPADPPGGPPADPPGGPPADPPGGPPADPPGGPPPDGPPGLQQEGKGLGQGSSGPGEGKADAPGRIVEAASEDIGAPAASSEDSEGAGGEGGKSGKSAGSSAGGASAAHASPIPSTTGLGRQK